MKKLKAAKLSLVFDEEKRKEYLTGFRKRKLERRAKARKAAEARLAEEIKAVKMKYRKTARERLAGLSLPMFIDGTLDAVKSREEQVVGDHSVVFEKIDISNSHYFVGANQPGEGVIAADKKPADLPKMSLKAALKMNPTKNRRRFTRKSKRKRSRK
ncbi:Nucleolar protein 12 [Paragonimus heterotremus]|uniref:Nucleolar protein 12 n=1 Tax=Paragonimus heterotremus TaxID=100268 RepID=A0A8J4T601_9TREM|nr:Nucleolar protein 12 [Paragonimus heterotremus]